MADAMQGIMGLPQAPTGQDPAAEETINPEFFSPAIESYARNNPVQFGNDMLDSMAQTSPELVEAFRARLAQLKVPPEVIEALGQMVDVIMASPENYAEIRERLIEEDDVPEELLPETLDLAYFGALNIALDQLAAMQQPAPIRMANGGIATLNPIALELARMGRNGDRMLAHITPSEARLLRMRGGSGTINPETGLPEFFLKKLFKGIGNALKSVGKAIGDLVKDIASSTVGKIILTAAAVYFMGPAGLNLAGTAGSITGLTGAVAVGVNTFAASTLVNLASGQSLGQSLKSGAIAGITAGFGSSLFDSLPSGYEGGAPKALPPVADAGTMTSAPAAAAPPGSAVVQPGSAASAATGASDDVLGDFIKDLQARQANQATTPAGALDAARAPVTSVTAPNEVISGARSMPVQPQSAVVNAPVDASAVTQAAGRTPLFTPEHYAKYPNATFLRPEGGLIRPEGGINVDAFSGTPGIKIPGVTPTPTVQQVGIEALTPSNLSPAARAALADPAAATTRSLIANTGQAAASTATQTTPGVWESLKQGNFTDAAKAAWNNISPSEIQKQGALTAEKAGMDAMTAMRARLPSATPEMLNTAYQTAYKAALPGIVSTYGPMALAGLGVMGAMGGFKAEQPERPPEFSGPTGVDLLKSNPETYGLSYGGTRSSYALNPYDYMYLPPLKVATGGIASLDRYAHGGQPSHFPRKTGPINGPGTGTSDSIPAMLSDGEFVFTAKAVRGAGGGSRRAGAKKMYALMKALERKA